VVNLLIILVAFLLGAVLRRMGRFGEHAPAALNAFVLNISLPAAALLHVHELRYDSALIFPVVAPWVLFCVGAFALHAIGRAMRLDDRTIGCMILLGGLGNTSFVGLPMIEAMYGRGALGIGILADQPGGFLVLSTLGLVVASRYSAAGDVTPRAVAMRIARFVPFWAMIVGFALSPIEYPPIARTLLERFADTLTPLAMVSVGTQLRVAHLRGRARPLTAVLAWKMLAGAALILAIGSAFVHDPLTLQVTVFEMAMPPMVTAGIIAVEHDLDPPLASLLIGVGIPLSLATLPLWAWLMR
jgi:predicted permease